MKVAVVGSNGQLGIDICKAIEQKCDHVYKLTHNQIDIADFSAVENTFNDLKPDFVINTAAMHNVDACESDPVRAFTVNALGARNLATVSLTAEYTLFHISTDYVFSGEKREPYIEEDLPCPLNVYGNSKLAGEYFIRSIAKKYFILRGSGLYGNNLCRAKGGLNFVSLMLKLSKERDEIRVVDDEYISPTFTENIAEQIVSMYRSTKYGLYHCTAQGGCSWYDFAKKIFELTGTNIKLSVALPGEFPSKVQRPTYSVLENGALKAAGLDVLPHWEEGLRQYLTL